MIHLFHGEQVDASRKELLQMRGQFAGQDIVVLNGKTISPTDLIQATQSPSLFGTRRLVIVENLLSRRLSGKTRSKEAQEFSNLITNLPGDCEIVFWEEKEAGKTSLSLFPQKTDIALFRPNRNLFKLVEALRPQRGLILLELLEQTLVVDSAELVFTLMVRQFHYLILIKAVGKHVTDLAPWQIARLDGQAEWFTQAQLKKHYRELLDIDIKIKTGSSPFNLTDELKLFLMGM